MKAAQLIIQLYGNKPMELFQNQCFFIAFHRWKEDEHFFYIHSEDQWVNVIIIDLWDPNFSRKSSRTQSFSNFSLRECQSKRWRFFHLWIHHSKNAITSPQRNVATFLQNNYTNLFSFVKISQLPSQKKSQPCTSRQSNESFISLTRGVTIYGRKANYWAHLAHHTQWNTIHWEKK